MKGHDVADKCVNNMHSRKGRIDRGGKKWI